MKVISIGPKNEPTNYRIMELSTFEWNKLLTSNPLSFQDYLFISAIELSLPLLLPHRNGILSNNSFQIHRLLWLLFGAPSIGFKGNLTKSFKDHLANSTIYKNKANNQSCNH